MRKQNIIWAIFPQFQHNKSKSINKNYISFPTIIFFVYIIIAITSCKKLLDINSPNDQLTSNKVLSDDKTATAAISGIYGELQRSGTAANATVSPSCSADELFDFTGNYTDFYNDNIPINNGVIEGLWSYYFNLIYQTNLLMEGLNSPNGVSSTLKTHLIGECKFIRAFSYFELVNFYGSVPLITSSNVVKNASAERADPANIYNQIISDLKDAQANLDDSYISANRARANKSSATALLSRVYLYTKNWQGAEDQATAVIDDNLYNLLANLNDVFQSNSSETILQFANDEGYTDIGSQSIASSSSPNVAFTTDFYKAFEPGDARKKYWTDSVLYNGTFYHYPFKYKLNSPNSSSTEFVILLRLSEQFLIRAEARINNNKISAGISDLNIIRSRARLSPSSIIPNPLPPLVSTMSLNEAQLAVEHERRMELFTEFGHRWFDLKRTGRINAILSVTKPSQWTANASLYPIPFVEINANPDLTQNPGY